MTSHQTTRDTTARPDAATVTAVTLIADDLRQLIALRSRSSLRDRHFAHLFSLLDAGELRDRDRRYAALTARIDEGISAMADQSHREAAQALLGSGPGRWRTVSQRGGEAAAAFNCGWDAYRRRRTNGTSQLDDTVDALAEALTAGWPEAPSELDAVSPIDPKPPGANAVPGAKVVRHPSVVIDGHPTDLTVVVASPPMPARPGRGVLPLVRNRVILVTAVGAMILAVATSALVIGLRSRSTPARASTPNRNVACDVLTDEPGDLPVAADAELRGWSAAFSALAATLPESDIACAGPISRYNGFIQQQVAPGTGQGIGAFIASTDGGRHAVYLRHHEYWLWRSDVERYTLDVVGAPLRRADLTNGTQVVELAHGTIVSEGVGQPSFAIFGRVWEEWTRLGGLSGNIGRPLTVVADVPGQGRVQEFIGGTATVDFVNGELSWTHDPSPADDLPADYFGSVLISGDKTAWLIDARGARHWLPTDNDFICATGDDSSNRHDNVPATAIATLKLGAPFRCR